MYGMQQCGETGGEGVEVRRGSLNMAESEGAGKKMGISNSPADLDIV